MEEQLNKSGSKKPSSYTPKTADGTPITSMGKVVHAKNATIKQGTGEVLSAKEDQGGQGETTKVKERMEFRGVQSFRQRA